MSSVYKIKNSIASCQEIIQHKLLKSNELAVYSHNHGLSLVNKKYIIGLWRIGLLQADIIYSSLELEIDGLVPVVNESSTEYCYFDNRIISNKKNGWGKTLTSESEVMDGFELYFHPFRFYVLYHIDRIFRYRLSSVQYLLDPSGANRIVDLENEHLDKWSRTDEFVQKVCYWNKIVDISVFVEPWSFDKVFKIVRLKFPEDFETFNKKKEVRLGLIKSYLNELCLDELEKMREQLCIDSEILDDNKILHMLLRMMNVNMRESLKGKIGGAMLLFSMAEMLRLACEKVFDKELKEEDELGFGVWTKGVKKEMYGANRLYDAERGVKSEFMRQYGLDYGVRARCYVEGETEAGALISLLGISAGIEIVNLKGKIAAKGVTAFRDSLKQDIESQIFSIILIDGDREDYVRAIKKAAVDDEICGMFFISQPDFEFSNFKLNELAEVIVEYAKSVEIYNHSVSDVNRYIRGVKSGNDFMKRIKYNMPEISDICKGGEWGIALMSYATRNPNYTPNENENSIERPVSEVVTILLRCLSVGYRTTRSKYIVSKDTGKLVERLK